MFYLTTHSTHFIYGYIASDMVKDHSEETHCRHMGYSFLLAPRVILYAPSHNTRKKGIFYLMTHSAHFIYGYRVQDHSEKKPAVITIWSTLFDNQLGFFYMHHPTKRMVHTTVFVIPVVEDWLEREVAQCFHHKGSIHYNVFHC